MRAAYERLYEAAPARSRGRNVVRHGRAQDGRADHALVKREFHRLWDVLHPGARRVHDEKVRYAELVDYANTIGGARGIGYLMTIEKYGSQAAWQCVDGIIRRESGWNHLVWNRAGSGAYGLGQALPASKMAPWGSDYMTNPRTQMRWFFAYVEGRYGGPCQALAFWHRNHWY